MHVLIYNLHDIKIFASRQSYLHQKKEKRKKQILLFLLVTTDLHPSLTQSCRFSVLLPVLFWIYQLAFLSSLRLLQGSLRE